MRSKRTGLATLLFLAILAPMALARLGGDVAVASDEQRRQLERAEGFAAERSWARAADLFESLLEMDWPAEEARWLTFRAADARWRAEAANPRADERRLQQAREALESLTRLAEGQEPDRVWAEARESLADSWWERPQTRDWSAAWPHYREALDYWAASTDLERARERYLDLVWRIAEPPERPARYGYGHWGNRLPEDVLDGAVRLARTADEKARAAYLLAITLSGQGLDPSRHTRIDEAFALAIEGGPATEIHDDALYHYAEWLARSGRRQVQDDATITFEPDFARALATYRRYLDAYGKGESPWVEQARRTVEQITEPSVQLTVSTSFFPDDPLSFGLYTRNVESVSVSLHRIDLTETLRLDRDNDDWYRRRDPSSAPSWRQTVAVDVPRPHVPVAQPVEIAGGMAPGAYVIVARAGEQQARELLLVTRAALVVKADGERALLFVADALSGEPIAGAALRLAGGRHDRTWQSFTRNGVSDADGTATLDARGAQRLWAAAESPAGPALVRGWSYGPDRDEERYKIWALTDRPAYRPGDPVQWKITARRLADGGYETPAGAILDYEIQGPRGSVETGSLRLNRFGSAWSELSLDAEAALGLYQVQFWTQGKKRRLGAATLFRLEEYKLPEFRVRVETPEALDPDKPLTATVVAEYLFGGPVAGAQVDVRIYQRPLWIGWHRPLEHDWLGADAHDRSPWQGPGSLVRQLALETDASGRVELSAVLPRSSSDDVITVEARVTDRSRREIVGSADVRRSRTPYFAFLEAEHRIYRPGDAVTVDVRTRDVNERGLAAEGRVVVTRERFVEVWRDPKGREVRGRALDRLKKESRVFPPPVETGCGWTPVIAEYESEPVFETTVRTDDDGSGRVTFPIAEEGYYRVRWLSEPEGAYPVQAETALWVSSRRPTDLGYRTSGVEILVDRERIEPGRTLPVMITAPVSGSTVLLTVEGPNLIESRVLRLDGTAKLVELAVDERHVPNVYLTATMVQRGEVWADQEQLLVPPARKILDVSVALDRELYQPRENGTLTVTAKDAQGRPVAAEVALSLFDAAVLYIQSDLTADPRRFFYGGLRGNRVSTFHSTDFRRYARPEEKKKEGGRQDLRARVGGVAAKQSAFGGESVADLAVAEAAEQDAAAAPSALRSEGTVEVRSDFRATALWVPDVVTGPDGTATVPFTLPDSLTTWKASARAITVATEVGQSESEAQSRKPLTVRLQGPRFFVVGDQAVVSALVNNHTEEERRVSVNLDASGLQLVEQRFGPGLLEVPAGGEVRAEWVVTSSRAGEGTLSVTARGGGHADGMERTFPVLDHGIDKLIVASGKLRGDQARITLELPERRAGSTEFVIQVTPSIAVTMLDALPYLIDYPYGCTEQTMSRFLPAVIVARTLERLGVDPQTVESKLFGGIETAHADETHEDGRKPLAELDAMVRKGMKRLVDFQHADGGWGWWKEGEPDPYMTAYVVHGLALAREAGVKVDAGVLQRGSTWLDDTLVEMESNPQVQAFMLHATTLAERRPDSKRRVFRDRAYEGLWERRDRLAPFAKALLTKTTVLRGDAERAAILARNLENGAQRDDDPSKSVLISGSGGRVETMATARWGERRRYWRGFDGAVESTAAVLSALVAVDASGPLVEPAMNWLVKNRRGDQWSNTRDTAFAILALTDYLSASGELGQGAAYSVELNGRKIEERRLSAAEAIGAPSRIVVPEERLKPTANVVTLRRTDGGGPLYFAVHAEFFSLEEPIAPAGNEVFVKRAYSALTPQPTLLRGPRFVPRTLTDGGVVDSGTEIEVVLTLEAKNDYRYVVAEDFKPAGFEAADVRSGGGLVARDLSTGRSVPVYRELRDTRTALFLDRLPQGIWEIRFRLRSESPGRFHGLPTKVHAMYVPEIRANGAETRVAVESPEGSR